VTHASPDSQAEHLLRLSESDFPLLYTGSDNASVRAQRRYVRATAWRLGLAVVAAVFGALAALEHGHGTDPFGLAAALAFTLALTIEIWLQTVNLERTWYDGRHVAESSKTIAWRYAVGGQPFPRDVPDAESLLAVQLTDVLESVPGLDLAPALGSEVPDRLRELRMSDLATRRAVYLEERLLGQQRWYAKKAHHNETRTQIWKLLLIAVEVSGVFAGLATALGYITLDLTSIISTGIGCGVAWLALKQHAALHRGYARASHELALIAPRLERVEGEEAWAKAVEDTEAVIGRELTLWRAAHVGD
jgi:hypothetical protein